MKSVFDQHAEKLTAAERQAIWRGIHGLSVAGSRPVLRWSLSAATVMAALVIVLVVVRREPTVTSLPQERPGRTAAGIDRTSPESNRIPPPVVAPGVQSKAQPGSRALPHTRATQYIAAARDTTEHPIASSILLPIKSAGPGSVTGVVKDAHNNPVPYANVLVLGTRRGAQADDQGRYELSGLPAGSASLEVSALGFKKGTVALEVQSDSTVTQDVALGEPYAVNSMEEVEVKAEHHIDTKSSATKQTVSAEKLRGVPVDGLNKAVATRAGRSADVKAQPSATPAPPPVVPTTGGTRLPNDEVYDSMFFRNYGVNPFIAADEDSLSTFAVDVDAGSYTVMRRYIGLGLLPPADAVRVEEFVNFFPQGYPKFENDDFRILIDGAPSPFRRGYQLLRIGIKGREIGARDRKPTALTFVIDVSGSMAREDRLELVKQALHMLVDELRASDRIGIVVFGTNGRVLLEPTSLGEHPVMADADRERVDEDIEHAVRAPDTGRQRILEAIDSLHPEGSTNTEEGLLLGYEMARRGYRADAVNRIVLCSDGVANEGRTGAQSILERARTEADQGVQLSTVGFGMGNYNDVLMEQLADKGDGNYYYVDDLKEAQRVFVENLTGTLQTIAKDAKIQVAFDPRRIQRYRLIGFENRYVANRDFRNDKVDAGEIGAGHEVTALYEVKLTPHAGDGPIATARLRYAQPDHRGGAAPKVREIAAVMSSASLSRKFEYASPHLRLDAAVAEFAEILRGSYWARDARISDVLPVARKAAHDLRMDQADEFVSLVGKAVRLPDSTRSEGREK